MPKQIFKYTLSVETETKDESIKVMDAVTKLIKNVTPADLLLFATKVEKNPGIIQTAKKWL
jgi:hypothetical protein